MVDDGAVETIERGTAVAAESGSVISENKVGPGERARSWLKEKIRLIKNGGNGRDVIEDLADGDFPDKGEVAPPSDKFEPIQWSMEGYDVGVHTDEELGITEKAFWENFLDSTWQPPERRGPKGTKVEIPDGAEYVYRGPFSTCFLKDGVFYRKIEWDEVRKSDKTTGRVETDEQMIRKDFEHKIELAKKDKTGLSPTIYEYDDETGTIAMEAMEGISFSKLEHDILQDSARRFLQDLEAFHEQGLYHGDLTDYKHWYIQPDGRIRLIDFAYRKGEEDPEGLKALQETDRALAVDVLKKFGYKESGNREASEYVDWQGATEGIRPNSYGLEMPEVLDDRLRRERKAYIEKRGLVSLGGNGSTYRDPEKETAIKFPLGEMHASAAVEYVQDQEEFMKKFGGKGGLPEYIGSTPAMGYEMEYIPGQSLEELRAEGGDLTPGQRRKVIETLEEFYRITGRAHGDLARNEDNIRVTPEGEVKFIDPWSRRLLITPEEELDKVRKVIG